jgi:hypothetical protein
MRLLMSIPFMAVFCLCAANCAENGQLPSPAPPNNVFTTALGPDGAAAAAARVMTEEFHYELAGQTHGYFQASFDAQQPPARVNVTFDWLAPGKTQVAVIAYNLTEAQQMFVLHEIRDRLSQAETQPAAQ